MASTKTYPDTWIGFHNYRNGKSFDWQLLLAALATVAFYTVTFVEIAREIEHEKAIAWQLRIELPRPIA